MSVLTPERRFRPDRPGDLDESSRAISVALAHASRGYAVLPVVLDDRGKRLAKKNLSRECTDADQILAWWRSTPHAEVGTWLTGTGLVVLDVDGPEGEKSLATLVAEADGRLPETYEVTTGRGRHLWFQIPPRGRRDLATQYGHHHGRPELDIKMTAMMMLAGSRHRTGALYTATWSQVPRLDAIPVLPQPVWDLIEAVGRPRGRATPSRGTLSAARPRSQVPVAGSVLTLPGPPGRHLADMLDDVSDGREGRVFRAVLTMVRAGVSGDDLTATLLAAPLGGKVAEQRDPTGWLQHKIDSALAYVGAEDRDWDGDAYWQRVLLSGLHDSKVKVLNYLLLESNGHGIVARSAAKVGLGCALPETTAADTLASLRQSGWLQVLREFDPTSMSPKVHALIWPTDQSAHIPGAVSLAAPPHTPDGSCPRIMSAYLDHDAFRPTTRTGVPTLHGGYRLLCLLEGQPTSRYELTHRLRCSKQTLRRMVQRMVSAELVISDSHGHRLTTDPLLPLLDAASVASGTNGEREAQRRRYQEEAARAAYHRQQMAIPGTPEWREAIIRDSKKSLHEAHMQPVVSLWAQRGIRGDQLARLLVGLYERHLAQTSPQRLGGARTGLLLGSQMRGDSGEPIISRTSRPTRPSGAAHVSHRGAVGTPDGFAEAEGSRRSLEARDGPSTTWEGPALVATGPVESGLACW